MKPHTAQTVFFALLGLLYTAGCDPCNKHRQPPDVLIDTVTVTEEQTLAAGFTRHTVTGIQTELPQLPDVTGLVAPGYLEIADLDADGVNEIVCTSLLGMSGDRSIADGAVAVFTWDGVDLDSWTQSLVNATFAFPNEPCIRDMDDDGDLDIMIMDNFIFGDFFGGIYYLENLGGDITTPANWVKRTVYVDDGSLGTMSYHRAVFVDLDGDGHDDFITTRVCFQQYVRGNQYTWIEWFRCETDTVTYPSGFSGPYAIGEGAGFVITLADVDRDGDQDVLAPQFFNTRPFLATVIQGAPCGRVAQGDSLRWFENPGAAACMNIWRDYRIDNWYTSLNPLGKVFEVVCADLQNDGIEELVISTHNHQEGIWPAGIFLLEIPDDPRVMENWMPVTIDAGDPDLDPRDPVAVAADVYAVDRPGGPSSQGSPGLVRVRDITADGYPDIVVSGDGKGALYYYRNDGPLGDSGLAFRRCALYRDTACVPAEATFADVDQDGRIDIVAGIYDTSVDKADKTTRSGSLFVFRQNP